jgi:hypothetical protein
VFGKKLVWRDRIKELCFVGLSMSRHCIKSMICFDILDTFSPALVLSLLGIVRVSEAGRCCIRGHWMPGHFTERKLDWGFLANEKRTSQLTHDARYHTVRSNTLLSPYVHHVQLQKQHRLF